MVPCGISTSFPVLFPTERKVAHALLTRPPLEYSGASSLVSPLDLHVLSTPPAFVLSQDQTLSFNPVYISPGFHPARINSFGITVIILRYSCLYRFQGSVLTGGVPRESACVSYHHPKEMSTAFFNFFQLFGVLFAFANIRPKSFSYRFAFGYVIPSPVCQNRSQMHGNIFSHIY